MARNTIGLVFLAALLAAPLSVGAAPFPARGKFVYSDLCSGPEPFAMHGHRVELLHGPDGDFVTIEYFDNGFDSDIVHSPRVELQPATGALWFSYQDFSDDNVFEGTVTPRLLDGFFDDDARNHTLPRVPNSWPEAPPCQNPGQGPVPVPTSQAAAASPSR